MRAHFIRVVLSGLISLMLANSTSECYGQFGIPGFGGFGGIPGMGGMGGGMNFSPSVTNSITRGTPPASLGLFERDRQENTAGLKPKYSDAMFAKPLKPNLGASLGGPIATRRARDRRPANQNDDPRYALRLPPGLREVKKARRAAMTAENPMPDGTPDNP